MKEKYPNIISFIFSLSAIILSIITFCSHDEHTFNSDSTIISVFGIIVATLVGLVTILITWQIFSYFRLKETMRIIVDGELSKLIDDFVYFTQARNKAEDDVCHIITDTPPCIQIEAHVLALKYAMACNNPILKKTIISYIMERVNSKNSEINTPPDKWTIYEGKRNEYIYIVNKVDHFDKEKLINYINNACEVDKEGNAISGNI